VRTSNLDHAELSVSSVHLDPFTADIARLPEPSALAGETLLAHRRGTRYAECLETTPRPTAFPASQAGTERLERTRGLLGEAGSV
jgi:hypothetical protein